MKPIEESVDANLTRRHLLPSSASLLWVLFLFVAAIGLTRFYETPIGAVLGDYGRLGFLVFFLTTALAVVLPLFSNLPLVPFAVLLWGPWPTALILILGWVAGASISFQLAKRLQAPMIRHFPSVSRFAPIDRLIDAKHHIWSLVLLRMTFPMDILSYVLGLFSRKTSGLENALSTAIGGAPFALLFAFFPALPITYQLMVFGASAALFSVYVVWALGHRH